MQINMGMGMGMDMDMDMDMESITKHQRQVKKEDLIERHVTE